MPQTVELEKEVDFGFPTMLPQPSTNFALRAASSSQAPSHSSETMSVPGLGSRVEEINPLEIDSLKECCPFCKRSLALSDLFVHVKESHRAFLCIYCLTHFRFPKELMVHLHRLHRLPSQKYGTGKEYLQSPSPRLNSTFLCVECNLFCEPKDPSDFATFLSHECQKSTGSCPKCGAIILLSLMGEHVSCTGHVSQTKFEQIVPSAADLKKLHVTSLRRDLKNQDGQIPESHNEIPVHKISRPPPKLPPLDPLLTQTDPSARLLILIDELAEKLEKEMRTDDKRPFDVEKFTPMFTHPFNEMSDARILNEMIQKSCVNCNYCRQVTLIRIDKRQLIIHLLCHHDWEIWSGKTVEADPVTVEPQVVDEPTPTPVDWEEFKRTTLTKVFQSDNLIFHYEHELKQEFGEIPCPCLLCGFMADSQKNLFSHWRKVHSGVPYKCVMCQGSFLFAGSLFSHLCTGTPTPGPFLNRTEALSADGAMTSANTAFLQYQCGICDDVKLPGFFNYMVHLRKEHNKCELCLQTLIDQKELERHMKKHQLNYFCWKCDKAYSILLNYEQHLLWKHGTESETCSKCLKKKWPHIYHFCIPPHSFKCDVCGLFFTRAKSLRVHSRLHSEENLKQCLLCTEQFVSNKLVQKHFEETHVIKSICDTPTPPTVDAKSEENIESEHLNSNELNTIVQMSESESPTKEATLDESCDKKEGQEEMDGDILDEIPVNTTHDSKTPFILAEVQGPNLSEGESDSNSGYDSKSERGAGLVAASTNSPKDENNLTLNLATGGLELEQNPADDCGSLSPLLPPLDFLKFGVPQIPTFDDNSLPDHVIRENALFSLRHEHEYAVSTGGVTASASLKHKTTLDTDKNGLPVQNTKKETNGKKKRRHSSSNSSSTSFSSCSSCGSNCSCSSKSSDSSSSDSDDSSDHKHRSQRRHKTSLKKKNKAKKQKVVKKKKLVKSVKIKKVKQPERPKRVEKSNNSTAMNNFLGHFKNPEDAYILETDLDTDESGSDEAFHQKQLTEVIGKVPAFMDDVWTLGNESFLLRMVHGVSSLEELGPKTVESSDKDIFSLERCENPPISCQTPVVKKAKMKISTTKYKKTEQHSQQQQEQQIDETLYCICQCPHDSVSQMIGCDARDCPYQWFHFECVGILIPPRGKWYCPVCREKRRKKAQMMRGLKGD